MIDRNMNIPQDFANIIDKEKLASGDKNEFLRIAYALNPDRFEKLAKLQVPNYEHDGSDNFTDLLENEKFNFRLFIGSFKTNTEELIRANKQNRIVGK